MWFSSEMEDGAIIAINIAIETVIRANKATYGALKQCYGAIIHQVRAINGSFT